MPRSPLKPLSSAVVVFLLCASSARAQDSFLMENHPGFRVEWLQQANSSITDVALGDVNDDGAPDLFVVDGSSLELWRNNGRGEFVSDPNPVASLAFQSVRAFDADRDGRVDLVAAVVAAPGGIAFFKGLGGGRFAVPLISEAGTNYQKLAVVEVNSDGSKVVVATQDQGIHVLEWDGHKLTVMSRLIPTASVNEMCVADLNGDGREDLVASTRGTPWGHFVIFLSNGRELEGLVAIPNPIESGTIVSCDVEGDGDADLLVAAYSSVLLLRGNGTGRDWDWIRIPGEFGFDPTALVAADFDQDHLPELLIASAHSYRGALLRSFDLRSDPGLTNPRSISYAHSLWGPALAPDRMIVADLNRDQRPDLLLVSSFGPSYPRSSPSGGSGMVGVLLNHNGSVGGIHLTLADVPASSITTARFRASGPSEILIGGSAGLFLTSAHEDGSLTPGRRIGDGGSVFVKDLNHDGRDDLIVGLADGTTGIRFGRPDGPGPVTVRFEGRVMDAGDLDHDHRPDLLVLRPDNTLDIRWSDRHGRFEDVTRTDISIERPFLAMVGDADGNGRNELIVCRIEPSTHYNDDLPDTIFVYDCPRNAQLRLRHQTALANVLPYEYAYALAAVAGNLDGRSGDEIVVLTGASGSNASALRVLTAVGDGTYRLGSEISVGGEGPSSLSLADLDGDGDLDASCVDNYEGSDGVLHVRWNDGDGNLNGVWSRRLFSGRTAGATVGDFDGDGAPDIAILTPPWNQSFPENTRVGLVFGRRDALVGHAPRRVSSTMYDQPSAGLEIRNITPNPVRGAFAIRWSGRSGEPVDLEVTDVAGRRVRSERFDAVGVGERETRFDRGDLPAGLYWIRLRQGNETATRRLAVIR